MLRSQSFVKKTRKGNVVKVVKEHYLREDLSCGLFTCTKCKENNNGIPNEGKVLIVDTNVVLHQIDLLEHKEVKNVIILGTVLDEVKHQNIKVHGRLREMIGRPEKYFYVFSNEHHKDTYIERLPDETPNDRNDRAIRVATKWYTKHITDGTEILLLTNDMGNLQKAINEKLNAKTVHAYVESMSSQYPEWDNLLVDMSTPHQLEDSTASFTEHVSKVEIDGGLKSGKYKQGPLRMNRDNYLEAYVPVEDGDDILVRGITNLNRAINGDIVVVELLPKEQWTRPSRFLMEDDTGTLDSDDSALNEDVDIDIDETLPVRPTGRVVGIIRCNWKPYCGSLEKGTANLGYTLFRPVDKTIPLIRIKTKQAEMLANQRIIVCIDKWDTNSRYPSGHYVRTLGPIGDKDTETEVILEQFDVPHHPFPESVLACLPDPDWVADSDPDSLSKHRKDLRKVCIFSVDPPGCTDIDDALHVTTLPNGNYQVGVHIADVTHFLHEGTAMDKEAASRGTTVYLVNRRIDMLPALLGTNLCSLMSDVDRFAFSCIWELDKNAEIVSTEYMKTIIRSKASLTYEKAQNLIDDKSNQGEIATSLRTLNNLAKILKAKRMEAGALTLSSPEVKFIKDEETQNPIDVEMYQLRETNSMVEEFMLLANISVAKKIYEHFPSFAILRRHPEPDPKLFKPLLESLKEYGISLNIQTSKTVSDSLDAAQIPGNPFFNELLRMLTTRCMNQAVYFSSGTLPEEKYRHYGLAVPIYTHFTSPIRRYADDIVHRLLGCAIGVYPLSAGLSNQKIRRLATEINRRHRMAQAASRNSIALHTLIYFKDKVIVQEGYITRLKANGFNVLVPKYGIEESVIVSTPENKGTLKYDREHQTLSNESYTLKVFGKVTVEISVNPTKQQLTLLCLSPPIHSPTPISAPTEQKTNGKRTQETSQSTKEQLEKKLKT